VVVDEGAANLFARGKTDAMISCRCIGVRCGAKLYLYVPAGSLNSLSGHIDCPIKLQVIGSMTRMFSVFPLWIPSRTTVLCLVLYVIILDDKVLRMTQR